MSTDYRALCLELFGTDDVEKLQEIARKVNERNPRKAGRKRRFSDSDIHEMERLRDAGMPLEKIAENYGTSRQMVSRWLTEQPPEGCTMRMIYMYRQHPCTVIDVDFLKRKIYIQNKTKDLLHRAFGIVENPTWADFEYFLEDRCFPRMRGNCKSILKQLGLNDYDPLQIVEKTQGRMAEDDLWLKIRYLNREEQERAAS
ncbi:MAG: helix-turn-helix domain-containing protein [Oscillospiraceae bacterium]|nr:helix-turn-helix domain-containing protein [Oscillospiraceae bacterium]